ncbi:3-oxoacyl-[acyl-carrier-protein] synthase II [Mucilaginibacter frigoritolerans]|uniref:3-oxoacyl-[acyl-carrier-protein] synthase 2 n=1 Tax=Mucilaginibacter frigoritolerans TaxID=652788 RepID=A0A562TMM3_9SPHI|nr:beta-ketoacyl-ACP synthase II [Mucilaginibacter frigoritolerans]TWI94805.1 3-oxoacyl-[acyl-carrier-protein] synthase II [Mucilaginibacter frigoritolerans]
MKKRRVVVTGLGTINPLGNNVNEFWNNCIEGKSGAGPITKFDSSKFKTHFACEVKGFNAEDYFSRKDIRKYDLFTQYAVAATDEAVKDAGLNFEGLNDKERAKIGVIWASGYGGISTFEEQLQEFYSGDGTPRFNPFFIPKIITDIAAGVISMRYDLYGPNYCTVSACASSNTAIINAFDLIRLGRANLIIAGGSEASITPASIRGFNASQALSKRNDSPETASRPFDMERDGFVAGEGAGALIIEEYEHAINRGAIIYAEFMGGGMATDAYHLTSTHPEGRGAALGMQAALEDSELSASDIAYINAHATSTSAGDLSELKAIASIFEGNRNVLISATKSMTGHLLGAAGAVEAILTILAIRHQTIPATINTTSIDPAVPKCLNILIGHAIKKEINYTMNNTFGFGGHTATSIFGKME